MALENFTTYTETDPNARIAVTATRVTWAALTRNEDAYVYADKGAGYFAGNFRIDLTYRATGYGGTLGTTRNVLWALTNLVDDMRGIDVVSADNFLTLFANINGSGSQEILLMELDGGTQHASAYYTLTNNTDYYLTLIRDEAVGTYGTIYCYVYSDVIRTTLLTTLSVTLNTSKKDYRYLFAVNTWNSGEGTITHSGYTEAMEIISNVSSPTVSTQLCTSIVTTTATGNGTITNLGSSSVTEHGHCWSTSANPTTSDSKTTNGVGSLGAFTSGITGLTQGITYFTRAYATNSSGTSYGGNTSFIAGYPDSQSIGGEMRVKGTTLRYIGVDGIEYYIQGIVV